MKFKHTAIAIVAGALAAIILPPVPMPPSVWASTDNNLIVADGPRAGEPWSLDLTPYIEEPLDYMGPDSGVNEIAVMKGVQTAFTEMLIAAIGHSIDRDPCRMMVLQPTQAALNDFNRDKLQPTIDASEVLSRKVIPQTSRSATGSTSDSKRFPGGSLTLAIASSSADLRSKTIKKLFRDEIDQYEDDLDGQGSPLDLSDGRLVSFLAQGDWKKADISTPTIKGGSKIEARYEQGDQRHLRIKCPHCGEGFVFEAGPNFRYDEEWPHNAFYVAPCCGAIINDFEKNALVRDACQRKKRREPFGWQPTASRPGAFPSYHFSPLCSPFVTWNHIAAKIVGAGTDPTKLKALWNLWFGLPYEFSGDAPDHEKLMSRREEHFKRGHIPARGLILVASADVQMRGIWVEILAITPDRQTYLVDALYLDGSTESPDGEAFIQLRDRVLDRDYPDAFGRTRRLDALGIDSGYRSHVVYAFVRDNQRLHPDTGLDKVLALDGRDGWGKPAIGQPTLVDIDLAGRKVKKGCRLWPVGTWPIKGAFYEDLRKEGLRAGHAADPEGYCHFGMWVDETYFRQLTAEYLAEEIYRGRKRSVWKIRASTKDNHLLDCRVYNLALAEYLGLSSLTKDEWAALARVRGMPDEVLKTDLFRAAAPLPTATEERPLPQPQPVEAKPNDMFAAFAALNQED